MVVVTLILFIVVVNRYIIGSYLQYQELQIQQKELFDTQQLIVSQDTKANKIAVYGLSEMSQQSVLSYITEKAEKQPGLELERINQVHSYLDEAGVLIETYPFETSGKLKYQILLIDSLQSVFPASIRSLYFHTEKPTYNAPKELYTRIYFQRSK